MFASKTLFTIIALASAVLAVPGVQTTESGELITRDCLYGGDYFTCVERGEDDCALSCSCDFGLDANECLTCSSECITRVQSEYCNSCT